MPQEPLKAKERNERNSRPSLDKEAMVVILSCIVIVVTMVVSILHVVIGAN